MAVGSTLHEHALAVLRQRYPWPDTRPDFSPIDWSLDGGGRWLIERRLRRPEVKTILEIGSFLGGSILHWLGVQPQLTVVAVDPWPADWDLTEFTRKHGKDEWIASQLARPEGLYQSFLTNLWEYRDRVIPVRDYSPGILYELSNLGLRPDLIFLDSDKVGTEVSLCHQLFPGALITGDDWEWSNEDGEFPIRKPVQDFCNEHARYLITEGATWIIDTQPPSIAFRLRTLRRAWKQRRRERRRAA